MSAVALAFGARPVPIGAALKVERDTGGAIIDVRPGLTTPDTVSASEWSRLRRRMVSHALVIAERRGQ